MFDDEVGIYLYNDKNESVYLSSYTEDLIPEDLVGLTNTIYFYGVASLSQDV